MNGNLFRYAQKVTSCTRSVGSVVLLKKRSTERDGVLIRSVIAQSQVLQKQILDCQQTHLPNHTALKDGMSRKTGDKPFFTFGIIADVQYADASDGYNFAHTNKRYYRGALEKLKIAIAHWQSDPNALPSFVLQMGDALDGVNKRLGLSEPSLKTVLDTFAQLRMPVYHVWGNHEYYNFTQAQLMKTSLYSGNLKDSTPVENKAYYSASPHPKFRILALDTYEISLLASVEGSDEYGKAEQYLAVNKNADKNSGDGLEGADKRLKKFNGALAHSQLKWMEENLQEAVHYKQNVIIIGHCPVYMPSSCYECMCFNYEEVLTLLHQYGECIVGYLAGHDHDGGQAYDETGIMHLTLPGVLENDTDSDYGTVNVYGDRMAIVGNGRVPDMEVPLRYRLDIIEDQEPAHKDGTIDRKTEVSCSNGL